MKTFKNFYSFETKFKGLVFAFFFHPHDWRLHGEQGNEGFGDVWDFWIGPFSLVVVKECKKRKSK